MDNNKKRTIERSEFLTQMNIMNAYTFKSQNEMDELLEKIQDAIIGTENLERQT